MNSSKMWIFAGVVALVLLWGIGANNGIISSANNVRNAFGNIQVTEQRRFDLVKQLVPTIKGATAQEQKQFDAVVAQAAALSGTLSQIKSQGGTIDPKVSSQIAAFDKSFADFKAYVLSAHPEMKTDKLFSDFMVQIEGSENRIGVARRDYNEAVTAYRNSVMQFPGSLVAGFSGSTANQFLYFEEQAGANQAPTIDFGATATPNSQ